MSEFPRDWTPLQIISYLERDWIAEAPKIGDAYITMRKGPKQLERDRERAAQMRKAFGYD